MTIKQDRPARPDDSKSAGFPAHLPNELPATEAAMRSHKRRIHSALLNRMAHADIFEVGDAPRFLFVLFGGSGVDEEEYERRSHTVIPVLGTVLERLAAGGMNVLAAYVSAPYDVPFNRFASNLAAAETW